MKINTVLKKLTHPFLWEFRLKQKNKVCLIKWNFVYVLRTVISYKIQILRMSRINDLAVLMIPTNRMCFFIFGCTGSLLFLCGLSTVAATLHCSMQASHCGGFSCCGAQALGHWGFSTCSFQALEQELNSCPVACGLFLERDPTCVSCIGRQILYPWASREATQAFLKCYVLLMDWPVC